MGKWRNRTTGTSSGIKIDRLDKVIEEFDQVVEQMPDVKRQIYVSVGKKLRADVRRQINHRLTDRDGNVSRWQDFEIGRFGGFVRVLPVDKTEDKWGYTNKAKTYYLEHGHAVPAPSGKWKRYRPRLKRTVFNAKTHRGIVEGRMFYSYARADAEKIALDETKKQMKQLLKGIGG